MFNLFTTVILFTLVSAYSFTCPTDHKKQVYAFVSILIFLAVALRDGSALNDYENYVDLYNNSLRSSEVEPSFHLIANMTRSMGGVGILFFIYALLGVGIKVFAFPRLTNLLFLTLVIYIANIMILHDMTQIRAGVASGFFLYSIPYLEQRQRMKYFICVVIATFFHLSGILFLLPCFYWFKRLRSFRMMLVIVPIGYMLGVTIFDISNFPIESIRLKLQMYKNLQEAGAAGLKDLNLFNPYILFRIGLYYVLLWKWNIIASHNKFFPCLMFCEALALFVFPALSSIALLGYRGSELLGVVEIILYPMLYYVLKPKYMAKLSVIGIGCLLLAVNLTYKHLILF